MDFIMSGWCPWFITPYLLHNLCNSWLLLLVFIIPLTTSLLSYAVSHDLSKSHCRRFDWLNGIHLIQWGLLSLRPLSTPRLLQVRLLINLLIVLPSQFFTCLSLHNLASDIVYMLPFYALIQWRFNLFTAHHAVCAVRLRFSNRHGYCFSYLTGSSPIWDLYYFSSPCYQIAP